MSQSAIRPSTAAAAAHSILSSTHSDASGTPARGDMFVRSAGGLWVPMPIGAAGRFVRSDGSDPSWSTIAETDIVDGAILGRLADAETVAGQWTFTPGLRERGRTVNAGEWQTVPYAAGDFTANGGMTWTVDVGDLIYFGYSLTGKTMTVGWRILTSSVTAPLSTNLQIKIPGGFSAASTSVGVHYYSDAGTFSVGYAVTSGTNIFLRKPGTANWTASVNLTESQGTFSFEVA